jgi:hypothetical protein
MVRPQVEGHEMRVILQTLISLSVAALLAACARSPEEVRAGLGARGAGGTQSNTTASSPLDADMVAAVSNVPSTTPISLHYRLDDAPQVDKPVTVELTLVTDANVHVLRLHLSFHTDDGLELRSSSSFDVEEAEASGTLRRQVVVVPRHGGVLQLHATAVIDSSNESVARVYSIPLIAAVAATPAG